MQVKPVPRYGLNNNTLKYALALLLIITLLQNRWANTKKQN